MLFQKHQIRTNDLIDGHAKGFSVDDQWLRLRKQNLDEEHLVSLLICLPVCMSKCSENVEIVRGHDGALGQITSFFVCACRNAL